MFTQAKKILKGAKQGGYAVPAFSTSNLEITQAIIRGAVKKKSPLIVLVSPRSIKYAGAATIVAMVKSITEEEAKEITFKRGKGCVHCDNTGYSGRAGIFEMLEVTVDIRKLIFAGEDQDKIRDVALKNGMRSLHEEALYKMKQGITTIKEVIKLTISD